MTNVKLVLVVVFREKRKNRKRRRRKKREEKRKGRERKRKKKERKTTLPPSLRRGILGFGGSRVSTGPGTGGYLWISAGSDLAGAVRFRLVNVDFNVEVGVTAVSESAREVNSGKIRSTRWRRIRLWLLGQWLERRERRWKNAWWPVQSLRHDAARGRRCVQVGRRAVMQGERGFSGGHAWWEAGESGSEREGVRDGGVEESVYVRLG